MRNKKTAWLLALCLLGQSGVTPVYGAMAAGGDKAAANADAGTAIANGAGRTVLGAAPLSVSVQTKDVELNPEDGSASVPVEMKATVSASLISVSLPADGFEFTVDPEQTFDISTPSAQITSPDVTVVNHSVVPVKLEISSVPEVGAQDVRFSEKFSDYVDQSFRLVDTISGVGPPGTAILVLGDSSRRYSSSEEFERYAILPRRTGIFVAEIPAEDQAVIKLYGKAAPDFYGEFEFTVRPTLKISAARANEPADSNKK